MTKSDKFKSKIIALIKEFYPDHAEDEYYENIDSHDLGMSVQDVLEDY